MTSIELSTLSRLVTTLKNRGHVSRIRPNGDGRTVEISLSEKGAELVKELMPLAAEFDTIGIGTFTETEVEWLKGALRQIYDNLAQLDTSLTAKTLETSLARTRRRTVEVR